MWEDKLTNKEEEGTLVDEKKSFWMNQSESEKHDQEKQQSAIISGKRERVGNYHTCQIIHIPFL